MKKARLGVLVAFFIGLGVTLAGAAGAEPPEALPKAGGAPRAVDLGLKPVLAPESRALEETLWAEKRSSRKKPPASPETPKAVDVVAFGHEVAVLVNVLRGERWTMPLEEDESLTMAAFMRASELPLFYSHERPNGENCFSVFAEFGLSYGYAGENIAKNPKTPVEVVDSWYESEGHRENMLNPNYDQIGVGLSLDADGNYYWVQLFRSKK
ncbi:MAG: CAP domain-containing protein [Deltaproteobacteria bacterium]|jgi:uncharacterized protein YkwD|nr:CAP domain-containing protein [Deltaproteobacteria bacterium]